MPLNRLPDHLMLSFMQGFNSKLCSALPSEMLMMVRVTMGCPYWKEDTDFFGTGVATWISDRIELYLVS
jgi:hypothetical protein